MKAENSEHQTKENRRRIVVVGVVLVIVILFAQVYALDNLLNREIANREALEQRYMPLSHPPALNILTYYEGVGTFDSVSVTPTCYRSSSTFDPMCEAHPAIFNIYIDEASGKSYRVVVSPGQEGYYGIGPRSFVRGLLVEPSTWPASLYEPHYNFTGDIILQYVFTIKASE